MAIVRPCEKCGEDMAAPMYGGVGSSPHRCNSSGYNTRGGVPAPKKKTVTCDQCKADIVDGVVKNGVITCTMCLCR